jgi:hypothetical protein
MERYKKIYALPKPLLAEGAPVCILRGVLLFDSACECFVAQLKLKNLSDREISAVRVRITEKNGNGINYRERIAYTYDAVAAAPEASFGGRIAIPMAHKGIRSFDVTVCEVLFTDGEKWDGKDAVFAPAAQTPLRDVLPRDAQIAWRARYGKRAVYECAESGALWLCTCGTPNGKESATCSECGARRLALLTPDVAALTAEGYTHRTVALIAKGNENAFAEAEALIAAAPEGVDAADLAHKLEAGRLALAEKQARRRRGVKIALGISIPAAVLAIAITLLSVLVLVPFGHYNKGVELAKSNQYYDAYCELREANGFNNAETWIETVTFNMLEEVRRLLKNGNRTDARALIAPFADVDASIYDRLTASEKRLLEGGDGSSFSAAKWMSTGYNSFYGSSACYYVFIPSTTGYYNFYSLGGYDMDATLYNSNYSSIKSDGSYGNFNFNYHLTAGSTYYLKVTPYGVSYSVSASIYVELD